MAAKIPAETRFWKKVRKTSGCWIWTGSVTASGYGRFWDGEKVVWVHAYAYELQNGPIPEGCEIDHVKPPCTRKDCVRGTHLEAVPHSENMKRWHAGVTHCKKGHAFDEANTYITKAGARACRRCKAQAQHDYLTRQGFFKRPRNMTRARAAKAAWKERKS
jgi:hypothetical protein